jgi:hypothetical protein
MENPRRAASSIPQIPLAYSPVVDWSEPNLRFVDLDGDGHADILITEDEVLTWHRSLAREGFESGVRIPKPKDEEEGPAAAFADSTEAIFLADLSGDGLTDIVRIRNGEVCYLAQPGLRTFRPQDQHGSGSLVRTA